MTIRQMLSSYVNTKKWYSSRLFMVGTGGVIFGRELTISCLLGKFVLFISSVIIIVQSPSWAQNDRFGKIFPMRSCGTNSFWVIVQNTIIDDILRTIADNQTWLKLRGQWTARIFAILTSELLTPLSYAWLISVIPGIMFWRLGWLTCENDCHISHYYSMNHRTMIPFLWDLPAATTPQ